MEERATVKRISDINLIEQEKIFRNTFTVKKFFDLKFWWNKLLFLFPKKATPLGSATAGGTNDDDDGNVSGSGGSSDGQGTDGGTDSEGTNGGGTNGDGSGGSDSCQDRGCISNLARIYS